MSHKQKSGQPSVSHGQRQNRYTCSSPKMKCLPFLARSFIGFKSFCNSGQNILTKFTIPAKLQQPLTFGGGFNCCIASILLLMGLTCTCLSFMNIVLPIYCNSVLNNWHFFGDISNPFLHKAFNKSSSLWKCVSLDGVNNNRSSISAPQHFLLDTVQNCIYV